ncbi:hypothetical protein BerOc1_03078 [Pseudodesulfovibrio hydrargyri]|uniref:Uncharacterized protein n=1 Tax=Pseudodesulfovibrio hydrargyri TaxID=2125990 RepID=A0A1J5MX30_9BACT|nr:hypothetical protein [Pseudodesulfovibrio hydrargyri]OIQ51133.1 hypothetical protein BerOc1_03078 [Pseudodesulfovibrio hydrargyri]
MSKNNNQNVSQAQNNNHENKKEMKMEKQNMNQRGGEEYTSGTGGPGLPGGYSDQPLGFDAVLQEENKKTLAGGTGGLGGVPEDSEEVIKDYSYDDLLAKLKEEVPNITDKKFLITKVRESDADYKDVFAKASKIVSAKAYVAGVYLNQLKFLRSREGGWMKWADETFPEINKTARENRMRIASLPGVENYFDLGVERLSEFGRYYNKLTVKQQTTLSDDPIGMMLREHGVTMGQPFENNRTKIDSIMAHYDLAQKKINVSPDVIEKFFKAKLKITGADRKYMALIAQKDEKAPGKYLDAVRAAGGEREGLLLEATPDASIVDRKIKNIDTQVSKLGSSLKEAFRKEEFEGSVDLEAIDELIESLQKLRSTLRSHA